MMRFFIVLLAVFGALSAPPALARRAALIIGNSTYLNTAYLPNPKADSQLVAQAVRRAGFNDVIVATDLTRAGFDQALRDFRSRADGAEVAMIYYAGHGIESGGKNWVIPVDAALQESRDLRFEAIELDGLLETLQGSQLRIVILDACRNNPFGSQWRSAVRSVPKGLAETEVEGALVIFAAAGGQVATDGGGANSPFATALYNRIPEPGLSIHRLGSVVREDVLNATGGKQTPWTNMSIDGREFFLVQPAGATAAPTQPAGAAGAPSGYDPGFDALMYNNARRLNTVEAYQGYLNRFPQGLFIDEAQSGIARLRSVACGTPVAAAQPAGPVQAPVAAPVRPAPSAPATAAAVPAKPPVAAPTSGAPVGPGGRPMPATEDPASVEFVTAAANTVHDRAALPVLPATPRFPADGYPDCRESFQQVTDPIGRVTQINACLSSLTQYFENVMNGFARSMIDHQGAISRMYTDQVAGNTSFSPESQQRFYRAMMAEHAASNPDGANYADFRAAKERYERDRAYLQDRYCMNTGACGGYPVPAGVGKVQ